jgi:hypothetical protein
MKTATRKPLQPDPVNVRGTCPYCGDLLVSNAYYQPGTGYVILIECWASLQPAELPTCKYRRQIA